MRVKNRCISLYEKKIKETRERIGEPMIYTVCVSVFETRQDLQKIRTSHGFVHEVLVLEEKIVQIVATQLKHQHTYKFVLSWSSSLVVRKGVAATKIVLTLSKVRDDIWHRLYRGQGANFKLGLRRAEIKK